MTESALSLVERLRAALDRAEEIARAAPPDLDQCSWSFPVGWIGVDEEHGYEAACVWRDANSPAHVLRTVAAHRKILDRHAPLWRTVGFDVDRDTEYAEIEVCGHCVRKHAHYGTRAAVPEYPCDDVRDLAAVYFPEETTDG